jgi:endonuclease/exonuclease/phosphatase (EEP) superfamily protein YafD
VLALALLRRFSPARSGVIALSRVFAPQLQASLVAPVLLSLRGRLPARAFLFASVAAAAALQSRRRSRTPSIGASDTSLVFSAVTWNQCYSSVPYLDVRSVLLARRVNFAAFQEADWEWIEHDAALVAAYPYRLAHRRRDPSGLVLLSTYPLVDAGMTEEFSHFREVPRLTWARADLGAQTVVLVVAHPAPPRTRYRGRIYETSERDRHISLIRGLVDELVAEGEDVLLMGDLNLTEREPAYGELAAGLHDLHREVGRGYGHTWRPEAVRRLRPGLLRIDYMLSTPRVRPMATFVDRKPRGSDHSILYGRFALGGPPGPKG